MWVIYRESVRIHLKPPRNKKPLKTGDFSHFSGAFGHWAEPESNRRHKDFQTLPQPCHEHQ